MVSLGAAVGNRLVVVIAALLTVAALSVATASAQAQTPPQSPSCATTTDSSAPTSPSAGNPCWTDVEPYPFGVDGNPISPTQPNGQCSAIVAYQCYLQVTSMALRAWNRGLAATAPTPNGGLQSPYGVWLYNGSRWYPDPTFPGPSTCPGSKILWAGKLDYWLIGPPADTQAKSATWPTLCRFDGANFQWEPLPVPTATIAKTGSATGAITAGSCFAWNNCWFFGTGGAVLHWDGNTLTDESVGLGFSPWLDGSYTDAIASTGGSEPVGLAVADANAAKEPDGTAAPQLFTSTGGSFTPSPLDPSTLGDGSTNLVSVSSDSQGDVWTAADPNLPNVSPSGLFADDTSTQVQASPVLPVSPQGTPVSCATTPSNPNGFSFPYYANGSKTSYLWSSVAAVPDGSFIAGGAVGSIPTGGGQQSEPVLFQASCSNPAQAKTTLFRIPDPTNPSDGTLVPADQEGYITAVAASATNDAWAASSDAQETLQTPQGPYTEPPHLYQLTDGQPPDAPAGDDNEPRPVATQQEATVFVIAPPVVVPAPPPATTATVTTETSTTKTVRLKAAVYDIAKKPKLRKISKHSFRLSITFKVRRKVTIGLDALYHGRVVSKSGLKTFTGHSGTLAVIVERSRWPTGLKFVQPGTQG